MRKRVSKQLFSSDSGFIGRIVSITIHSLRSFFSGCPDLCPETPYIRDSIDLKRYMSTVIMAVLPCTVAGVYLYGWRILAVIMVSYIFGVGTETVSAAIRRQNELHEGAFVTCIIYALTLPPGIPLWMAAVGIVFGIIFGKEVFGGTGKNIFNPAMTARIFVALAFPEKLTMNWIDPSATLWPAGFGDWVCGAVTSATPLISAKSYELVTPLSALFWGKIPGCIGETVKPCVIAGGLFLMVTRVANWRLPVTTLFSAWGCAAFFHAANPAVYPSGLFHVLSGGLLFGAFFMASDPVTAPSTPAGKWIFGILTGILTIVIRNTTGYVEGFMFALIIMNAATPLIDHILIHTLYRRETGYEN